MILDLKTIGRETWAKGLSFGSFVRPLLNEIQWEEHLTNGWRYAHFKRRNVPYYYSHSAVQSRPQLALGVNREKVYLQKGEPATLKLLWDTMNSYLGVDLEFCAVNFYENERSALEWHSDDSPSIDQTRPIVVLSIGAARNLWFRPIADLRMEEPVQMDCGSLLVMPAGFQSRYQHCVRSSLRPTGPRISMTFRGLNGFVAS